MRDVTSADNTAVRLLRSLSGAKGRRDSGLFRVEGPVVITEVAAQGVLPRLLVCTPSAAAAHGHLLAVLEAGGCDVVCVPEHLLARAAGTRTPQGMAAAYPTVVCPFTGDGLPARGMLLVLDGLQDPGNMGSLIRTADALGVYSVVLLPGCVDAQNDKVVRATMGSIFRVRILKAEGANALREMGDRGWRLLCGHLQGEDFFSRPADGDKVAVVVGGEAGGVSPEAARLCRPVRLPMPGGAQSLNAAVAGGILLYDVYRRLGACPDPSNRV